MSSSKKSRGIERQSGRYTAPGARVGLASANDVLRFLVAYVQCYRRVYERFTTPIPDGPGYPKLRISPYLEGIMDCHLARDGAVVCTTADEPVFMAGLAEKWRRDPWIAVPGDAPSIDHRPGPDSIAAEYQQGILPVPAECCRSTAESGMDIRVFRYNVSLHDLVGRLTPGAINYDADGANSFFWMPATLRHVVVSSWQHKRYFDYMEVLSHADIAAWDPRAAAVRGHVDVRRHFASTIAFLALPGGRIELGGSPEVIEAFGNVLDRLASAISGFQHLLDEFPNDVEETFHDYLATNPILLDVYATPTSKFRFVYPPANHPEKEYVEPDFILTYPGATYKLVELERPAHAVMRKSGDGRAETSHAAFQIAEWKYFLAHHPEVVADVFPHLALNQA